MKSIAIVTTAFPTTAYFIESDVHRLVKRGVRVQVFALRSPRGRHYQPEHEPLIPITRWVGSPVDLRSIGHLFLWLLRRPDVLVGDTLRMLWASRGSVYALAGHIGYLPATARIASLVEKEGYDRVHAAWSHFPGSVAYLVSKMTGKRFSMSAHAGSDLYRTQAFLAEKVRAADFVSACVRGNAEMLQRLAGQDNRVRCIYHGVDLRRFHGNVRARSQEPMMVAVGRLHVGKGFDDAISALGILAKRGCRPRLVIAGDGPERERLAEQAKTCGVESQVEILGVVAQKDLVELYQRAWFLITPSRELSNGRRDGVPNVVVEAMAMGIPCLGTHVGGLAEAIEPGITGSLVDSNDPESLAREIESLIGNPDRLDAMGRAARERMHTAFDADVNFEETFELFMGDRAPLPVQQGVRQSA